MSIDDAENTLKVKTAAESRPGAAPPSPDLFDPTARSYARLAAVSLAGALIIRITEVAWRGQGVSPSTPILPDATHLLVVGVGGSLLGLVAVREYPALVPDRAGRKGAGPRAFWIFAVGLLLHAVFQPLANAPGALPFFAILGLAGLVLELVAAGMIGLSLR